MKPLNGRVILNRQNGNDRIIFEMSTIRYAAVAGLFYPDDPGVLRRQLGGFLADVDGQEPAPKAQPVHPCTAPLGDVQDARMPRRPGWPGAASIRSPKALIVPHAGYVYS
ncbi:MAG: AmmeMemoRadiSam system protein B, partial [Pseudomonadota bacterium]